MVWLVTTALVAIICWMWMVGTGMVLLIQESTKMPENFWRAAGWLFLVPACRPDVWELLQKRLEEPAVRRTGCAFCDGGVQSFHDGTQPYHLSPDGKRRALCRRFMPATPKR